ncbi:hypothetical protein GYMLUDRAFT_171005, partial [Collybiopsis luxurians FD-317 M1]
MDSRVYENLQGQIAGWCLSTRKFCMANGSLVEGCAHWEGRVMVEGVEVKGSFEVFDSRGSWQFLFGKPLLEQFCAIHDYRADTLQVEDDRRRTRL